MYGYRAPTNPLVLRATWGSGAAPVVQERHGEPCSNDDPSYPATGQCSFGLEVPDSVDVFPVASALAAGAHHAAYWDEEEHEVKVLSWDWTSGYAASNNDFVLTVHLRPKETL